MSENSFRYVPWQLGLFKNVGRETTQEMNLLDFGCGAGECVRQFIEAGYQCYGCDIDLPATPQGNLKDLLESGSIRRIIPQPYTLPFEDDTFDIIFSTTVFEHVMDYATTLRELARITKPDGINVHVFPGHLYWPSEPHVFVPLGTIAQSHWWLSFWAKRGIRNDFQKGLTAGETAQRNYDYLHTQTNYMSQGKIRSFVQEIFQDCDFAEDAFKFNIPGRPENPYYIPDEQERWFRRFPFLFDMYKRWLSDFSMRVLVFKNKRDSGG